MVADRTFEAFNHGDGWPNGRPMACFIHATRSGQPSRKSLAGHVKEMTSTINWFKSPASRASTNLIISPTEIVRMVSDNDYGWHAVEHSAWAYSIETTQALPTDPFLDGHYELLAKACREYVKMGVPPVYLPHYSNGMEGFTGHEDSEQGVRDGKSDPGIKFDWPRLMRMIQEPVEEDEEMYARIIRIEGETRYRTYLWRSGVGGKLHMKNKKMHDDTAALYGLTGESIPIVDQDTLDAL